MTNYQAVKNINNKNKKWKPKKEKKIINITKSDILAIFFYTISQAREELIKIKVIYIYPETRQVRSHSLLDMFEQCLRFLTSAFVLLL